MQMQWGAVKLSRLLENCPDKRPYYQHLTAPVYVGLSLHLHVCTSENQLQLLVTPLICHIHPMDVWVVLWEIFQVQFIFDNWTTRLYSTNQTYPKWFQHKELGKQIQRAKEHKIPSEETAQSVKLQLHDWSKMCQLTQSVIQEIKILW